MRTCVIQFANSQEYYSQLNISILSTLTICQKYKYDYIMRTSRTTNRHPVWERVNLIKECVQNKYDYILWLDTDTYWIDNVKDLDEVWSSLKLYDKTFGCTWHTNHWNIGVLYVRVTEYLSNFIEKWLNYPETKHIWKEQFVFNKLIHKHQVLTVGHEWNSVMWLPSCKSDNPVIASWHGGRNVVDAMKEFKHDRNR